MPYTSSPQDLREAFVQLPDSVRKWLASEKVLAIVSDLNERLEYFGDKVGVIPWLITRLVVKDLAPKYFMSELRDYLVVSDDEARTIAEEIDKRILRPIEPALNRLDIDLNSLYLGQAPPQVIETKEQEGKKAMGASAAPTIGAREQFGIVARETETPNAERRTPNVEVPEGPVMLHTEKEEISQIAREKPRELPSTARPSFSISIPQSKYKKPAAPPPVTVKIETPEATQEIKKTINQESKEAKKQERGSAPLSPKAMTGEAKIIKVVHYSDFRTPL